MNISTVNTATPFEVILGKTSKAVPVNQISKVSQAAKSDSVSFSHQTTDSVTISVEATSILRAEKYALKTDPVELFMDWKATGSNQVVVGRGNVPEETLLPENRDLIAQFEEKAKTASDDERRLINANISFIKSYGDKEIFTNEEDVFDRAMAIGGSVFLQTTFLTKKDGELPYSVNEQFADLNGNRPTLGSLLGIDRNSKTDNNSVSQDVLESIPSLSKFDDKLFMTSFLENLSLHFKT